MEIKTKYDIGQKVYWLDNRDGYVEIKFDPIININIGDKSWDRYSIGYATRAENQLFSDFDEAKVQAIKEQEEFNAKTLDLVKRYGKNDSGEPYCN